jgi:hypothetical protein
VHGTPAPPLHCHAARSILLFNSSEEIKMAETIAKSFFPSLYSKLEKKKQAARANPLSIEEINTLLSLRFQQ